MELVKHILNTGTCGLTTLEESFLLHRPFLTAFSEHFMKIIGKDYSKYPIR
jgi:hypothetical protein